MLTFSLLISEDFWFCFLFSPTSSGFVPSSKCAENIAIAGQREQNLKSSLFVGLIIENHSRRKDKDQGLSKEFSVTGPSILTISRAFFIFKISGKKKTFMSHILLKALTRVSKQC